VISDGFQVFVFDNAINSRSAFIDHRPIRLIVLAMMVDPPGVFNRGRGGRAIPNGVRLAVWAGFKLPPHPLGLSGWGGSRRAIGAKATTRTRCDCDSGNLEAMAHLAFAFNPHSTRAIALPLRKQLQRATVKGKLHSRESRVRKNAGHAVGIEDFQTKISARRHDFRGACGMKIDGVTSLFPRCDSAPLSFTSDVISICDKAATKLFGKLSEADLVAFFYKDFAALVSACRPGSVQIESVCLRS
jgi:hypothetical protein